MEIAKLTSKGQMTIPKRLRERFHMEAGDLVALSVEGDRIVMHKITPESDDYLQAVEGTLAEWRSPEDEKAWRDL